MSSARSLLLLLLVAAGLAGVLWLEARTGARAPAPAAASSPAAAPTPPAPARAREELAGTVARVHDGDTVTLHTGNRDVRVRLAQIDAPEQGQPWGSRAREALERIAQGHAARVVVRDRDEYGRTVGDLYVDGRFVNEELVRAGDAWAFRRFFRSRAIDAAEEDARRAGRGLWRLPESERVPPWEWRRAHPRSAGGR